MEHKKRLIEAALKAAANAYAPYSAFPVGAAVLGGDGNIYTGVNVENASYGAAICAERAAVCAAVAAGCRTILAAAVAAGPVPASPCGICRQVLAEFADPGAPVWYTDARGHTVIEKTVGELLPEAFALSPEPGRNAPEA